MKIKIEMYERDDKDVAVRSSDTAQEDQEDQLAYTNNPIARVSHPSAIPWCK